MQKPVIAMIYDFDKTLCTKDMQEYGFIPSLGMSADEFWGAVNELTDREQMDSILAYMFMMVKMAHEKNTPVSRDTFLNLGKGVQYFEGVEAWFDRITRYGEEIGVTVEHYIVSSGIKEIIEGTGIAKYFKKIYACEFMYRDNVIQWPKMAVNYTAKTQFMFRINKGVLDIDSKSAMELNRYTPEDERRVPFRHMIYIGDGPTDVPCMKLIKSYGGQAICVYDPEKGDSRALPLLRDDRVNFIAPADYREGQRLEHVVQTIIRKMAAESEMIGM